MSITRKDVLHVAGLARLALKEEEIDLYTNQLQRILGHVEKLSELDTKGVEPTANTPHEGNVFREDRARPSLPREAALSNAPESERGCFKVPKIIE